MRYAAFLRGINVGAHRRVRMADLRVALTSSGFTAVETYLQSGNIALDFSDDPATAATRIREVIGAHFDCPDVDAVLRTADELVAILAEHESLESLRIAGEKERAVILLPARPADPPVDDGAHAPDRFVVSEAGAEVHLGVPSGLGRTKLTGAWFERTLGMRVTVRNLRTLRAMADLAR